MIERPRSANPRQAPSIAEEKFPERFTEFSEKEKLGLDEDRFPLTMRGQTEFWPKAIAWLYGFGYAGSKKVSEVVEERFTDAFYDYVQLNLLEYDIETNPRGAFVNRPYKPENEMRWIVLRALGIKEPSTLGTFFGLSASTRGKSPISPTLAAFETAVDQDRDLFLITHRNEYPKVNQLLAELETSYGLNAVEIFVPGRTPRLKPVGNQKFTMEQNLRYLLHILSGQYTANELEYKNDTRGMVLRAIKGRLTPKVIQLIEERRKTK